MTRRRLARVVVMPLAILAAGGGIALWSAGERGARRDEVRGFVTGLLRETARGGGSATLAGAANPILSASLTPRLREAVAGLDGELRGLDVAVRDGDTADAGRPPQAATHTAALDRDGRTVLVLRLVHEGSAPDIAIIGFVRP